MGWTGTPMYLSPTTKDRKAFLDREFSGEDKERGLRWTIEKSAMRGTVYYAAIKREHTTEGTAVVYGLVCLTSYDNKEQEFYYKDMSEDMGPYPDDCPLSILDLLSPTTSEYALAWRERCRRKAAAPKLSDLPYGTVVEAKDHRGTLHTYVKTGGRPYGRKNAIWFVRGTLTYIPAARLNHMPWAVKTEGEG